MANTVPDDWVEMQGQTFPSDLVAPDGCHYRAHPKTGRVWVRPYHVADFVQHRLSPMTVVHSDVADVVADAISSGHHDIHARIAIAAQAAVTTQQSEGRKRAQAPTTDG